MQQRKRIVLCADDFGQAPAISQAIVGLIGQRRLTATSCMVTSPNWLEHAQWLAPLKPLADMGLHFNLTEGKPLSPQYIDTYGDTFSSLATVMRQSIFRQLEVKVIEAELEMQLKLFKSGMGFLPDFIDGHQHVHQFPVIRDALLSVYRRYFPDKKTYIRLAKPSIKINHLLRDSKKIIISAMGAGTLKQQLIRENIAHNASFSGIYSFKNSKNYADYFPKFLRESEDGGLIMCHPGLVSQLSDDPIMSARQDEYAYLASEKFLVDCLAQHVVLNRYGEIF